MDEEIKEEIAKSLETISKRVSESDEDNKTKARKLHSIMHVLQIMERYDELEPTMQKFFEEKRDKKKWKER